MNIQLQQSLEKILSHPCFSDENTSSLIDLCIHTQNLEGIDKIDTLNINEKITLAITLLQETWDLAYCIKTRMETENFIEQEKLCPNCQMPIRIVMSDRNDLSYGEFEECPHCGYHN